MRGSFIFIILAFVLSSCTAVEVAIDLTKKKMREGQAAISGVKAEPRYKIGNPYEVKGVWYYPERDLNYDETGIASWYGDEFAGKLTANGEIFDPDIVSAAHKTLPMPSAVRVTNLDNGRSLVIRINDRGPFVTGRIIDLSREAARLIGFKEKGIARVRVQILAEESLRLEREAKEGRFPLLGESRSQEMPQITAAAVPKVKLKSSSNGKQIKKKTSSVSSLELLNANRSTEVIELAPVETNIFIQVGAFSELSNAEEVRDKIKGFGQSTISTFDNDGQLVHRVRIGPINDVANADQTLVMVINEGFKGAKIILE